METFMKGVGAGLLYVNIVRTSLAPILNRVGKAARGAGLAEEIPPTSTEMPWPSLLMLEQLKRYPEWSFYNNMPINEILKRKLELENETHHNTIVLAYRHISCVDYQAMEKWKPEGLFFGSVILENRDRPGLRMLMG